MDLWKQESSINEYVKDVNIENLPGEIWKDFHGYQVSNLGRIRSFKESSYQYTYLLKQKITKEGYCKVTLVIDGHSKNFFVHRLVAILFLKEEPGHTIVNHKNGNTLDNKVDNLEWVTQKDNVIHAYKNKLIIPRFKPVFVIDTLKHKTYFFNSIISASKFFNMSDSTIISYIKKGKYKHYILYKVPQELLK